MRGDRFALAFLLAVAIAAAAPTCLASNASAQPSTSAPPSTTGSIGAGPFRVGMSLDEIRAAAPQVEWRDVMVSRYTGRVFSMRADGTLPIAGVDFEVEAMAHYYEHKLLLDGVTQAADAMACERAGLDVLTAIEPQAGPFSSNAPLSTPPSGGGLYWQTQRSANGSITVTPAPAAGTPGRTDGETLHFGNASTVLVEAFDGQYRPRPRVKRLGAAPAFLRMQAHHRGGGFDVQAEVNYGKDSGSTCAVRVEMRRWTPPPLPQAFDTSKATMMREASIAERHLVHAPLAGQPATPVDVDLACEIDRQTGWVASCGIVRPDGLSFEQEQVALNLARLTEYDVSAVDRDDPQNMRGALRLRVDPADRKPIDFLAAARTSIAEIEFTAKPDPAAARLVRPVLGGEEGGGVEVQVTCRIEADGSLLCADPTGATEAERKAVIATATRVAAMQYRVAPSLRTGAPSAGVVFDLLVEVEPAF